MSQPIDLSQRWQVVEGDCLAVLPTLPEACVDAVVTDPPYGLAFMGKAWDDPRAMSVAPQTCEECGNDQAAEGHRFCSDCLPLVASEPAHGGKGMLGHVSKNWKEKGTHSRGYADNDSVAFQAWCRRWAIEALRVAKPGAHLLAFGGTRTFHRLTCAIEDAGWEIRDCLSYLYGSGFPKSHNLDTLRCCCYDSTHDRDSVRRVSVAVPGVPPHAAEGEGADLLAQVQRGEAGPGVGAARSQGPGGLDGGEPCVLPSEDEWAAQPGVEGRGDAQASARQLPGSPVRPSAGVGEADGEGGRLHHGASAGDGDSRGSVAGARRGGASRGSRPLEQRAGEPRAVADERGAQVGGGWATCDRCGKPRFPAGLGTALKPAWEPIVMARKPLVGTVAANHAAHGTGALNIDGCRIPGAKPDTTRGAGGRNGRYSPIKAEGRIVDDGRGRWPANVVLDEAAARLLDEQSGERKAGVAVRSRSGGKTFGGDSAKPPMGDLGYGDSGGASRFFYTAKASRSEREAGLTGPRTLDGGVWGGEQDDLTPGKRRVLPVRNTHPTVKPVDLMRWCVRLVTPVGGLVLDPFAGSGTTGIAANEEGCRALLIEREPAYVEIARARNKAWAAQAVLPLAGGA